MENSAFDSPPEESDIVISLYSSVDGMGRRCEPAGHLCTTNYSNQSPLRNPRQLRSSGETHPNSCLRAVAKGRCCLEGLS